MKKKLNQLGQYYDLPNPGLRAYFMRTEHGNSDDYRPPFWKGKTREEVLTMWQKVIDTLGVKEKYPSLYDFEMEMKSKVGPMSIQLPLKERYDSIENYFTHRQSEPLRQEAIKATIDFFAKARGIRLRSPQRVIANMRLSTNSGAPYFTKRRRMVNREENAIIKYPYVNYQDGKSYRLTATLGWRGQEGGIHDDDVKQRVIWMMPFSLNIKELQFYQPAIEAIQKFNLIPAYVSMDAVDKEVTMLFDSKGTEDDVICTDFSKFDQHFNADMQECAKQIINGLGTNVSEWLEDIFPIKFKLPLVCSESVIYEGDHGMGSGSGGTNFDECLSHKALQFEAAIEQNAKLNEHSMAYGDDGILTYPGIKVDDVIRVYERHGQEMNPDKQYVSKQDCVVLRRWHSTSYRENGIMVGVYATFRALGRLLAQERFYDPEEWGPEQVTLRAWSILENCNHSPYFEQFVDFVMQGDKYRLGLDIPGFMSSVNKIASKSIDQLPDFLGYTKTQQRGKFRNIYDINNPNTGIKSWRIYKYLATKK